MVIVFATTFATTIMHALTPLGVGRPGDHAGGQDHDRDHAHAGP
jgi:hypothetical protein